MSHAAVPVPDPSGLANATMVVQDKDLQNSPTPVVTQRRDDIDAQLMRIGEVNRGLFGRWTMSRGDKALLQLAEQYDREALDIMRKGDNEKMAAFQAYSTRWMREVLHHASLVGESNLSKAARLHFDASQAVFQGTLLKSTEAQLDELKEYRVRAEAKGDTDMLELVDHTRGITKRAYMKHVTEFTAILEHAVQK